MRAFPLLLVGAGGILIGHFIWRAPSGRESAANSIATPPPLKMPQPVAEKVPFTWGDIESRNYKEYIANLQRIGCPLETIRDIIIADVNKLYAPKFKALSSTNMIVWESAAMERRSSEMLRLKKEKRELLEMLLGKNLQLDIDSANEGALVFGNPLAYLSLEKRQQVADLNARYQETMGAVESSMLAYIERRLEEGALSVSGAEVMDAVVPPDHPEFRERPAYQHGLDRLLRRHVINAVDDRSGMRHYFIGTHASAELRQSLGL
jgi:hypothetical protein